MLGDNPALARGMCLPQAIPGMPQGRRPKPGRRLRPGGIRAGRGSDAEDGELGPLRARDRGLRSGNEEINGKGHGPGLRRATPRTAAIHNEEGR